MTEEWMCADETKTVLYPLAETDLAHKVFWAPEHPLNQALARRFGIHDESLDTWAYAPHFSQLRDDLHQLLDELQLTAI